MSEDALGCTWEGSHTSTGLACVDSSVQLKGWVKLELLFIPWQEQTTGRVCGSCGLCGKSFGSSSKVHVGSWR